MMTFHWTEEYIDEFMTIPRLIAITDYWKDCPPIHETLVAIKKMLAIRWGAKEQTQSADSTELGTAEDLMRDFGMLGGVVKGRIDLDLEP